MRATVDADLCTGCELCVETCPDVFEMEGDVAVAKVDDIPEDAEECAKQAAEECPVEAINIEE
ncbi:ferredoxin [candidate division TA06 bacterium DG_26]|uniref:Ferredoxin n=1 Tax=candidate division TA06 bacterium DG_26 TaxID=1703771 RepID=A0A0S7WDU8_UNCT6|nr:MAG: ferredoxin [candidate division TA06 bacterium DG_26]